MQWRVFARLSLLEAVKDDPDAAIVATGYLQAADYHGARRQFLTGSDALTEFDSPKKIAKGLVGATEHLTNLAKEYPGASDRNVAKMFKLRVLARLKTLEPDKYNGVRDALELEEAKQYKKAHPKYLKEVVQFQKAWESKVEEARKQYEPEDKKQQEALVEWKKKVEKLYLDHLAEQKKSYGQVDSQSWPEIPASPIPPISPEDRVGPPPKKPIAPEKPFGYEKYMAEDADIEETRRRLFTARHLVRRVMRKSAVYHGIEPGEVEPYAGWAQANPNRLDDGDLGRGLVPPFWPSTSRGPKKTLS
jgi:hypothetical protein